MFTTTELVPLLHERGITLSAPQVHRLVHRHPRAAVAAGARRALRRPGGHPG
jgi:hypothetical protein